MANCDGRWDGTESSKSQLENGNPIEHDEGASLTPNVNGEEDSASDKSWIVLNPEGASVEKEKCDSCVCLIESNEDYPSGECLQTQNSTQEWSSSGFQALSIRSETYVKEVVDSHAQEEQRTNNGQNYVLAPSDLSSSIGSASVCSTQPDYHCDECELIESNLPSQDSKDFWSMVPRKGLDETGCHKKFVVKFIQTLKDFSKDATKLLTDTKVSSVLLTLLKVDLADETAVVEYKNFARLVKFLGPVRPNECVMVQQIRSIKDASIPKDKSRREKVSWFAGEIKREAAEDLLKNRPSGTYLIRMSQTNVGNFAVSVKHEESVSHVEIVGDYKKALTTDPYNAVLTLNGNTYTSLVEAVKSLKTNPLKIIDDAEDEDENVGEDDLPETERSEAGAPICHDVFCKFCCPDLALNSVMCGYKKTRR